MKLETYFRSVIDQDISPVVLCNLEHEIIYMNPAAVKRYEKQGGEALMGKSLFFCHNQEAQEKIKKVV